MVVYLRCCEEDVLIHWRGLDLRWWEMCFVLSFIRGNLGALSFTWLKGRRKLSKVRCNDPPMHCNGESQSNSCIWRGMHDALLINLSNANSLYGMAEKPRLGLVQHSCLGKVAFTIWQRLLIFKRKCWVCSGGILIWICNYRLLELFHCTAIAQLPQDHVDCCFKVSQKMLVFLQKDH